MIRYKNKEFEDYNIDPVTAVITDQNGVVQKTYMIRGRLVFKKMHVHCIMANTYLGYKPKMDIHHLDENPLNNSLSNLVYLTRREHRRLHMTGKPHSEEAKAKISDAMKGNPKVGHLQSDETKAKISTAQNGMIIWNNGEINRRSKECPGEGWKKGRLNRR